jgi:hypothetical protein
MSAVAECFPALLGVGKIIVSLCEHRETVGGRGY